MSAPKKALVTGATGLLGRAVVKVFETSGGWSVMGIGFSRASPPRTLKCDLTNREAVEKVVSDVKPSVIVHCAADRSPDSCSANPSAALSINVTATSHLASIASASGILFIYISTDYVFPGRPGEAPYSAPHPPEPTNVYGELKLEGEKVALAAAEQNKAHGSVAVLRLPALYGDVEPADNNKESAITVLLDLVWKAQKEKVTTDDWALRYPTNTQDVGRVCKDIAEKYLASADRSRLPRILQFSSEDQYTKYQICELIAEVLDVPLDGMIANKQGNEPGKIQRPYNTQMDTAELRGLGIDVSTMDFKAWWRLKCRAVRR